MAAPERLRRGDRPGIGPGARTTAHTRLRDRLRRPRRSVEQEVREALHGFASVHPYARQLVRVAACRQSFHRGRRAAIAGRLDRCDDRLVEAAGRVAEEVDGHVELILQRAARAGHLLRQLRRAQRRQVVVVDRVRRQLPAEVNEPADLLRA